MQELCRHRYHLVASNIDSFLLLPWILLSHREPWAHARSSPIHGFISIQFQPKMTINWENAHFVRISFTPCIYKYISISVYLTISCPQFRHPSCFAGLSPVSYLRMEDQQVSDLQAQFLDGFRGMSVEDHIYQFSTRKYSYPYPNLHGRIRDCLGDWGQWDLNCLKIKGRVCFFHGFFIP